MKVFIAFGYFFGSILVIFGLLWLMIWVAPLEFVLDRAAISNHNGKFDDPERYSLTFPLKNPLPSADPQPVSLQKVIRPKPGCCYVRTRKRPKLFSAHMGATLPKDISGNHPVRGSSIIAFPILGFVVR